jgi:Protein of unknown function (DUF2752)
MCVVRRPLAPGENDYELIWLCVTLASLALAATWFAVGLPWPHCAFLALTGHPCITCGATRCAIAFFHANLFTAWKWNPLVFITLCAVSIFDAYAFVVLVTCARRLRLTNFSVAEKKVLRVAALIGLVANWIYLLSHPAGVF